MAAYPITREPLIWASSGGPFEFRVEVQLRGRPKISDCDFFDGTMALASGVLRRAAAGNIFTGFDDVNMKEPA